MIYGLTDENLANGVSPTMRLYCDVCERTRPMPGFVQYERYQFCDCCACEYERARMRGSVFTAGQYLRGKRFGELYALDE